MIGQLLSPLLQSTVRGRVSLAKEHSHESHLFPQEADLYPRHVEVLPLEHRGKGEALQGKQWHILVSVRTGCVTVHRVTSESVERLHFSNGQYILCVPWPLQSSSWQLQVAIWCLPGLGYQSEP